MEIVLKRFPNLGKKIINLLDDQSLVQSRKVSRRLKNFVDQEKTIWIRIIKKRVDNFETLPDWQKSVSKIPTAMVRELADAVHQFYDKRTSKNDDVWAPLHIAAKYGNLNLAQAIIEKVGDKNPKNKVGFTPLHIAAKNRQLHLVRLLETV